MTAIAIGLDAASGDGNAAMALNVARSSDLGETTTFTRLAIAGDVIRVLGCVVEQAAGARTYSVQLHTVLDYGDNGLVTPGSPVGPIAYFPVAAGGATLRLEESITPFSLVAGVRYCAVISQTVGGGSGSVVTSALAGAISVRDNTLSAGVFNDPFVRSGSGHIVGNHPHVFALGDNLAAVSSSIARKAQAGRAQASKVRAVKSLSNPGQVREWIFASGALNPSGIITPDGVIPE